MKTYEFKLNFYETFGTFDVEADNFDEAYEKGVDEIMKAIKDLPVEVEFGIDLREIYREDGSICYYDDDEEEEEDDDEFNF